MYKTLLFLLLGVSIYGQKLHHQAIVAQGANVKLANNMIVSQSIGQSSAIGNFRNNKVFVGQGFIQSKSAIRFSAPTEKPLSVIVYPNPIVDLATFKFSSIIDETGTINVFDNRGRLVFFQKVEIMQGIININLLSLSAGIYFVKFETSNNSYTTKILKS
jgi:hypothetical protein